MESNTSPISITPFEDKLENLLNVPEHLEINTNNTSNQIQKSLIEMGFQLDFINKIFFYYQVTSVEMAMDYMTKVNNKWNHQFLAIEDNTNDTCLVCGESENTHKYSFFRRAVSFDNELVVDNNFLVRFKSSPITSVQFETSPAPIDQNEIKLVIKNDCRICLSPIDKEFRFICSHKYCEECIFNYILNKINSNDVQEIYCPEGKNVCPTILDDELIRSVISGKDLEKYDKFLRRAKILKIPNSVICPIPDCDSYALIDNLGGNSTSSSNLKCLNNHDFCTKCNQLSHPGLSCDLKLENEFKRWVGRDKKNVRRCPQCSFFIQKNEGCNHMTCANTSCNYQFCWICMGKYGSGHYNNPLSACYKLQYSSPTNLIVRCPCLAYFVKIGMVILAIIILALAIVFSSIFALLLIIQIFRLDKKIPHRIKAKFPKFIFIIGILLWIIAFMPLGWILLTLVIAVSPFFLILVLFLYIGKKLRGH